MCLRACKAFRIDERDFDAKQSARNITMQCRGVKAFCGTSFACTALSRIPAQTKFRTRVTCVTRFSKCDKVVEGEKLLRRYDPQHGAFLSVKNTVNGNSLFLIDYQNCNSRCTRLSRADHMVCRKDKIIRPTSLQALQMAAWHAIRVACSKLTENWLAFLDRHEHIRSLLENVSDRASRLCLPHLDAKLL